VLALAGSGVQAALRADPALARGVAIWRDRVANAPTAAALGLPAADLASLLDGRARLPLSA
jgi:alanine dehydrogenase